MLSTPPVSRFFFSRGSLLHPLIALLLLAFLAFPSVAHAAEGEPSSWAWVVMAAGGAIELLIGLGLIVVREHNVSQREQLRSLESRLADTRESYATREALTAMQTRAEINRNEIMSEVRHELDQRLAPLIKDIDEVKTAQSEQGKQLSAMLVQMEKLATTNTQQGKQLSALLLQMEGLATTNAQIFNFLDPRGTR